MRRLLVGAMIVMACASNANGAPAKKAKTHSSAGASALSAKTKLQTAIAANASILSSAKSCSEMAGAFLNLTAAGDMVNMGTSTFGRSLFTAVPAKDQYETSSQYNAKVHDILSKYVGDPDHVMFEVPIGADDRSYDADTETLTLHVSQEHPDALSQYLGYFLFDDYSRGARSVVPGVTMMGVHFKYERYTEATKYLIVPNSLGEDLMGDIRLKMPVDDAKASDLSLVLLVFGKLSAPYVQSDYTTSTASLTEPSEITSIDMAYTIEPTCAVLYDFHKQAVLHTYLDTTQSVEQSAPPSPATSAPQPAPMITMGDGFFDAHWARQPDISDYYPTRAQDDEIEGSATLTCEMADTAGGVKCDTVSETPAGYGFGEAAVKAYEAKARIDNSAMKIAVGSKLKTTVHFQLKK